MKLMVHGSELRNSPCDRYDRLRAKSENLAVYRKGFLLNSRRRGLSIKSFERNYLNFYYLSLPNCFLSVWLEMMEVHEVPQSPQTHTSSPRRNKITDWWIKKSYTIWKLWKNVLRRYLNISRFEKKRKIRSNAWHKSLWFLNCQVLC